MQSNAVLAHGVVIAMGSKYLARNRRSTPMFSDSYHLIIIDEMGTEAEIGRAGLADNRPSFG
jgi:hypothetical protein